MESLERVENSLVGVGEVELVLAIILQKERVGLGEKILIHIARSDVGGQGERTPHEHGCAIADEAGDCGVGQLDKIEFPQRCIHAVAQVLSGIDQRAVEIEDEQLELLDGNRAKDANHVAFSVKGQEGALFTLDRFLKVVVALSECVQGGSYFRAHGPRPVRGGPGRKEPLECNSFGTLCQEPV